MPTSPLSGLSLDYWYKAMMAVSATVFVLTGAGLLHAFPVAPTASLAAGWFFVSMGEWVNHPLQVALAQGGILSGHPRNNSITGLAFVLLGAGLIAFGAYAALNRP